MAGPRSLHNSSSAKTMGVSSNRNSSAWPHHETRSKKIKDCMLSALSEALIMATSQDTVCDSTKRYHGRARMHPKATRLDINESMRLGLILLEKKKIPIWYHLYPIRIGRILAHHATIKLCYLYSHRIHLYKSFPFYLGVDSSLFALCPARTNIVMYGHITCVFLIL
jgi:hypothetical protein